MITTKQRAYLKSIGAELQPLVQIGKDGLTKNVITSITQNLEAHELIKVKVLPNSTLSAREACTFVCEMLNAEPVLVIGNKFLVYRFSSRKDITHIKI